MMGDWRPNSHCKRWTDSEPSGVAIGHGNALDEDGLFSHADCWVPRHLLCVTYAADETACAGSD